MRALIGWLSRRRLPTLHALGGLLGWLAWWFSGTYRRHFRVQIGQAGYGPAVRRQAIAEAGRMAAELPWLWLRPPGRPLGPVVQWQGAQCIDAAMAAGRGIVILTPHLGCFEVAAQAFAEAYGQRAPLTVMYRPARQPWLRALEEANRARPGMATAPASLAGVRQMIRALRRGEVVGLLPDQVPPEGMGVWAPFFGRPAYTMTLAARLVQQTGAALLLIWAERLAGGRGWLLRVSQGPALPAPAGDDAAHQVACASAINHAMEGLIAACPGQYLWGYDRFKRPRRLPAAAPDSAGPG